MFNDDQLNSGRQLAANYGFKGSPSTAYGIGQIADEHYQSQAFNAANKAIERQQTHPAKNGKRLSHDEVLRQSPSVRATTEVTKQLTAQDPDSPDTKKAAGASALVASIAEVNNGTATDKETDMYNEAVRDSHKDKQSAEGFAMLKAMVNGDHDPSEPIASQQQANRQNQSQTTALNTQSTQTDTNNNTKFTQSDPNQPSVNTISKNNTSNSTNSDLQQQSSNNQDPNVVSRADAQIGGTPQYGIDHDFDAGNNNLMKPGTASKSQYPYTYNMDQQASQALNSNNPQQQLGQLALDNAQKSPSTAAKLAQGVKQMATVVNPSKTLSAQTSDELQL